VKILVGAWFLLHVTLGHTNSEILNRYTSLVYQSCTREAVAAWPGWSGRD
jgi:hypothetical protein